MQLQSAVECMLASLRFIGMEKNKIIFKWLPTDSTVQSSIAGDTMIISSITVMLMPFKHHNSTSQHVSKEDK